MNKGYIKLELPNPINDYNFVELISERVNWHESDPFVVVWLNIECVRDLTLTSGQKWPTLPSDWDKGKLKYFIDAWRPTPVAMHGSLAFLPRISIKQTFIELEQNNNYRNVLMKLFYSYKKENKIRHYQPTIIFGNGRHRTEFFRFNGVMRMPFETRRSNIKNLLDMCDIETGC